MAEVFISNLSLAAAVFILILISLVAVLVGLIILVGLILVIHVFLPPNLSMRNLPRF